MMSLSLKDNSGNSRRNNSGGDDSDGGSGDANAKLLINQEITLVNQKDDSDKYTGRCIGATADSQKAYVTTIDGEVYVTSSASSDETRYYIKVDDEKFYDSPKGYFVNYAQLSLDSIVTIPRNLVYEEQNKTSGKQYKYVWKLEGDEIVKQYVTLGDETQTEVCILTGLSEGDVIIKSAIEDEGKNTSKKSKEDSEE